MGTQASIDLGRAPFSPAGPTALITLGFYVILLWPIANGLVEPPMAGVLIPIGIIIAIIQLICGMIELRNGQLLGGTVSLAFSCFMALGAGETILKFMGLMPADTGPIDGYIMTVMGLLMVAFLPVAIRAPLVVFLFYLANALFFTPAGLGYLFGMPLLTSAALKFMLVVAPLAVWIGISEILAAELGRPVLWLGPPVFKG